MYKRGISSIVGGIFFLVLMTSGFTVYYIALDTQSQMLRTQQIIADVEVKKIREQFTISVSTDSNDNERLAIQVTNEGNNLVEIADAWIINTTATSQPAIKYEIKYGDAFIPARFNGEILASTPLYMSPGKYDIKVVSTLGTIVTEEDFDPNSSSGEETVIVGDLFSRPGIFMVIPSPYGWTPTGNKGLWGMNIVNPTDRNMWVNKAVLSLVVTRAEEHDELFKLGSCSPTGITPPIDVWACTTHNQLKWEPSVGNQHLVPPKSVQQFLAVADEGRLHGNVGVLDTVLVTGSVFTTLGQFAKTGYGTAMQQNGDSNNFPIVNVYLTRDEINPLNVPDIHTTELGMISGTAKTFYAVLADFDPDNTKFIKNNISRLIINIPSDWTHNSSSSDHFTLTVSTNPDGSTQIIGVLDDIIDGEGILAGRTEAGIIEFNVTPPTVSDNKMYVMHILADGYTDADFLIGPIAEVVLQVCPTGGCS